MRCSCNRSKPGYLDKPVAKPTKTTLSATFNTNGWSHSCVADSQCHDARFLATDEEWEPRSGPTLRVFVPPWKRRSWKTTNKFLLPTRQEKEEIYWPGLFIILESRHQNGKGNNYAYFRVRSDRNGGDFKGPQIEVTGWWTLGMSFTPDGMVHYFASLGRMS